MDFEQAQATQVSPGTLLAERSHPSEENDAINQSGSEGLDQPAQSRLPIEGATDEFRLVGESTASPRADEPSGTPATSDSAAGVNEPIPPIPSDASDVQ